MLELVITFVNNLLFVQFLNGCNVCVNYKISSVINSFYSGQLFSYTQSYFICGCKIKYAGQECSFIPIVAKRSKNEH
jgi:hypothetical protein